MELCPEGYTEADVARRVTSFHILDDTDNDCRDPFQHDCDRILYSPEFLALAGKTQVVAAHDMGSFHNRLTHSLKVAQMGRRMTQLLTVKAQREFGKTARVVGPSADLVEAACLLHDVGHPAFGHIGEEALCDAVDEANGKQLHQDGFQANAQNFRIAMNLSCRAGLLTDGARGLNLTAATLDSTLKYPWRRDPRPGHEGTRHWCVYGQTEQVALTQILEKRGAPIRDHHDLEPPGAGEAVTVRRPVEEQIMDWADEISYVCHDLEDFTKAGLIPLDDILAASYAYAGNVEVQEGFTPTMAGVSGFWDHLTQNFHPAEVIKGKSNPDRIRDALCYLADQVLNVSKQGKNNTYARASSMFSTSALLRQFLGAASLWPKDGWDGVQALTGYNARLHIDPAVRDLASVLHEMVVFYVIRRPGLATQQSGQARIIKELYEAFVDKKKGYSLLSDYWRDIKGNLMLDLKLDEGVARIRVAADVVSSMGEDDAVRMYRRLTGIDYGNVTDVVV